MEWAVALLFGTYEVSKAAASSFGAYMLLGVNATFRLISFMPYFDDTYKNNAEKDP